MKHLLPDRPRYFKTALHIHTDVSDGFWSPEQLKAHYKGLGYSAVAFSDHYIITSQSQLNDPDFLALTAYEAGFSEPGIPSAYSKICHFNVLAKYSDHLWQAGQPVKTYKNSTPWLDKVEMGDYTGTCDVESINRFIALSNAQGFLCTYNHPNDSFLDEGDDYRIEGLWGMEIYNHCAYLCGQPNYNDKMYQTMLMKGKRIFPIASDDCHSAKSVGGAAVMVGAEELSYESMIQALSAGDFYATTAPQIHSLVLDGYKLRVKCTEATQISLITHCRIGSMRPPFGIGAPVTEAEFDLTSWVETCPPEWEKNAFFRLVITDAQGKRAYTRPYWRDEIL